ncbi:MAG TPA: UDP-N-acetylglucosamine--N-acetylmuramyl-(pentapeptide) pyrophosphoryl-undecaprenol N-acetylglucosamine transferase, partial [Actinobacteria bacterium]|nr:UDP-N-acetylglucosamine--N-acetylmuramyl-(pentapeptide) pyrophosphoryl-undecaprenol N-acetylglucosamine transferase [Actinomycetes bacterium]HEX21203.1 UDP-N-acetylglucosamine--N-acetylmuramyl-(pentapeptide) pyrophosphoryl-undecaprenol N-acetylglucosamine transferase [Actinomycetota bacterium]
AVVVGMGGYVSLPFMLAARGRYPMVILEQNSVPGLANRVAGRWAKLIAATYEESRGHFSYPKKVIITGNPVRRAVLNIDRNKALQRLSLSADKRTILIFGGSRGARRINQAAVGIYPIIRKQNNIQIIHITGKQEFERTTSLLDEFQAGTVKVDYHLYPYIKEIWLAYAAADLIVGRAGATTLAEITAAGLPAILIPYPYATDNHQLKNATVLKRAGAAEIVLDNQINSALLWEKISDIIFHEDRLNTMSQASLKAGRPAAAERIAELILEAAED